MTDITDKKKRPRSRAVFSFCLVHHIPVIHGKME